MGLRGRSIEDNVFFVTTTCHEWLNVFNEEMRFEILYSSFDFYNKKYDAQLLSYVIMPNHIHFIIFFSQLNKLSPYMRDFKKFTSGELRRMIDFDREIQLLEKLRFKTAKQEFKIWMDRFDDVVLTTQKVMLVKLDYIHENPVRKNLVASPEDYLHSSASYYLCNGEPKIPITHYAEIFGYE